MNDTPNPILTPAGRDRLLQRLQAVTATYQAVCADNEVAATCGESSVWHDSFDYEENQRQMHMLARKVAELRQLLQSVRVIVPERVPPRRVSLGCTVVCSIDDGPEQTWEIGGWNDGDPQQRRLAYNSPLGEVLVGAEAGECREWLTGRQAREVLVVAVRSSGDPINQGAQGGK